MFKESFCRWESFARFYVIAVRDFRGHEGGGGGGERGDPSTSMHIIA